MARSSIRIGDLRQAGLQKRQRRAERCACRGSSARSSGRRGAPPAADAEIGTEWIVHDPAGGILGAARASTQAAQYLFENALEDLDLSGSIEVPGRHPDGILDLGGSSRGPFVPEADGANLDIPLSQL